MTEPQPAGWEPELVARFSDLLLHLYQDASAPPEGEFQARTFERLKALVAIDSGGWALGTADVGPEKIYAGAHLFDVYFHNMSPKMMTQYSQFSNLDTFTQALAQQPGVTRNISTHEWYPEIAWPYLDHFGFQHLLGTHILNPDTGLTTGVFFSRSDRARPFSEQERLLKQALMPHWAIALNRARIEPWMRDAAPSPQYPAAAIVDASGMLRHAADGFAGMLQREWPGWQGPMLPEPLRDLIATGKVMAFSGAHIAAKILPRNHMALVQVRSRSLADQLSEQQLMVARHAANGLGNKEIAKLMGLSPATVRNYLTIIYAKLGVKNKLQIPKILAELE